MTQPTGKAIAADPDVFLAWSWLIKRGTLPDRGMRYSPELSEQLGDGRHAYLIPAGQADAAERDLQTVVDTYTGSPPEPALWTPN